MKSPSNTISVLPHKADQKLCHGASSGACDIWIYGGNTPKEWKDLPLKTTLHVDIRQPNAGDNLTTLILMWTDLPRPPEEKTDVGEARPRWRPFKWYRHGDQIKVYLRRRVVSKLRHPLPLGYYEATFQILEPKEKVKGVAPRVYRILALGHSTLALKSKVEPPRAQRNKIWTPGQDSKPGPGLILPGDPSV